jgi:hypothetical protein
MQTPARLIDHLPKILAPLPTPGLIFVNFLAHRRLPLGGNPAAGRRLRTINAGSPTAF